MNTLGQNGIDKAKEQKIIGDAKNEGGLKTNTIYGMTQRDKATFARDWHKVNAPVNYCVKVKVCRVDILDNGDQYFTYVPVGFSSGLCRFGCTKLSKVEMIEFGPAAPPPPHWYPQPGNVGYDLMC